MANRTDGTVARVDATSSTVVATVKVGATPLDGDVLGRDGVVPDKGGALYPVDAVSNTVGPPLASHSGNPFVVAGWDHLLWAVDYTGTDVVAIDPTKTPG
ncbi:MAG: hypothetical protein ABJA74_07165 [Lapillicoccus sp.]